MDSQQKTSGNNDLKERERIRYQYMLNRIQKFKNLVLAIALGMMIYAANATNSANNLVTIFLLAVSCITILISLIIAGLDAGGAIFYNEESQEGVSKKIRITMYICILISSLLIFIAQIYNAIQKIDDTSRKITISAPQRTKK